jgi:hypothetical protein
MSRAATAGRRRRCQQFTKAHLPGPAIFVAKENSVERLIAEDDEENFAMRHINEALNRHAAGWVRLRTSPS